MKRVTTYLALMIAASLLAGCGKESIAYNETKPLSFLSLSKNIKDKTRAEFKEDNFGVVVYHATNDEINSITGADQIFDQISNKKVIDKTAYWEIDDPNKRYYWPDAGSLFFAAYAPYSSTRDITDMPHNFNTPYRWTGYENDGKTDLQFADVQFLNVKTSAGSPVPVKFNHALAMVSVDVCVSSLTDGRETWDTTLKGVRLVNIRKKGSVTINNNEGSHNIWSTSTNDGVWQTETGKVYEEGHLSISYPTPITLTSDPVRTLSERIVIPQALLATKGADQQMLELNYNVKSTIHYKDPDGNYKEEIVNNEYTQSIPLYQTGLERWEMGKHIKYSITINFNKPIDFEVSTNTWTDGDEITIK